MKGGAEDFGIMGKVRMGLEGIRKAMGYGILGEGWKWGCIA